MIHRLCLTGLGLIALFTSGCLFSKKDKGPKENPSIPGSVAETFKTRWVDKRVAELVAQGQTADVARAQALKEFAAKYDALTTEPAKK